MPAARLSMMTVLLRARACDLIMTPLTHKDGDNYMLLLQNNRNLSRAISSLHSGTVSTLLFLFTCVLHFVVNLTVRALRSRLASNLYRTSIAKRAIHSFCRKCHGKNDRMTCDRDIAPRKKSTRTNHRRTRPGKLRFFVEILF